MEIAGFIASYGWILLLVGAPVIALVLLDVVDAALHGDDGVDISPVMGRGDRPR